MPRLTLGGDERSLDGTLLFMHLPKTGGTSVRNALRGLYPSEQVALIYDERALPGGMTRAQFDAMTVEESSRLRLVMGHFAYGIHGQFAGPCRYVTIVRDPVDRVVSLYSHYRNLPGTRFLGPAHRERLRMRWRRISLDRWVFDEQRLAADNLVVRRIAGGGRPAFGRCDEAMYERAVTNLRQDFLALLVTEEMEASRQVLARRLGQPIPPVPADNANPNRRPLEEFDAAVLDRIRDLNRFDARLHAAAREWLARQAVGVLE